MMKLCELLNNYMNNIRTSSYDKKMKNCMYEKCKNSFKAYIYNSDLRNNLFMFFLTANK